MCDFISKNKELFNQLDLFINSTKDVEFDKNENIITNKNTLSYEFFIIKNE